MACSGAHCTNHSTGTTTCSGHRSVCPSNRSLSQSFTVGESIKKSDLDDLRNKIAAELTTYRAHALNYGGLNTYVNSNSNQGVNISPANAITSKSLPVDRLESFNAADDGSDGNNMGSVTFTPVTGNEIRQSEIQIIVNKYNSIRTDCICNTDCACNAVCTCHNDCGCHY